MSIKVDKYDLLKMLMNGRTHAEIADDFRCTLMTINNYIKKFGIKRGTYMATYKEWLLEDEVSLHRGKDSIKLYGEMINN